MGGRRRGEAGVCVLNWLDAKKRAGLIGPDVNKKKNRDGQASVGRGGGGGGGQYLRKGDNIC